MHTCPICDKPTILNRLCRSCAQKLRRAREHAAKLTTEDKHARARAAAQTLLEQGYVAVRLYRGRE